MSTLKSSAENLTLNADGANNDIILQSNGSTKVTLDGQNTRLGIGTATPDGTAHIHTATAGSVTANSDADDLVVENSSHAGINILSPDASRSAIQFGHTSDNLQLQIRHDGSTTLSQIISDDSLTVNIADGSESIRVTADGITFQGDTAAANALDDYEEGTFTPKLKTPVDATYTTQGGYYTKIGNVVNVWGTLTINSIGSASSGTLDGLPFTVSNDANGNGGWFTTYVGSLNRTAGAYIAGQIVTNTDRIDVFEHSSASGVAAMTGAKYTDGAEMYFYGNYRV